MNTKQPGEDALFTVAVCQQQSRAREAARSKGLCQGTRGSWNCPHQDSLSECRGSQGSGCQLQLSSIQVATGEDGEHQSSPGEMKKVLASFLSVVMSRISFVMLTKRPETGGIRRKSRILKRRTWNLSLLTSAGLITASC